MNLTERAQLGHAPSPRAQQAPGAGLSGNRRRRTVAALVGTVLTTSMLGSTAASADPLQRIHESVTTVSCVFDTEQGASVIFEANSNNRFGSDSLIFVEEASGEMTLVGYAEGAPWSGAGFDVTVPLVVPNPEEPPAGTASLVGTHSPSSATHTEPVRHRDGNAWTFGTASFTDLAFAFTLISVPGYTVLADTAACNGSLTVLDFTSTAPAASVRRSVELGVQGCAIEGLEDAMVRLRGSLRELTATVMLGEGRRGIGTVDLRGGTGTGTFDVVDSEGQLVTQATITVSLREAGPAEVESFREHGMFYRAAATPYAADVKVTTGEGDVGTASCEAWYVTERMIDTPPGGDSGH